jgi:hypothetical protein
MRENIIRWIFSTLILTTLFGVSPLSSLSQDQYGIIQKLEANHPDMGRISINQDIRITNLLNEYYIQNATKPGMQGFRIRIYFDLGQQSRTSSQETMDEFMESYPGIAVYRTFDSPYYKVSVGDFRTRDEALKFLKTIDRNYPKAFIVTEWINFPSLE